MSGLRSLGQVLDKSSDKGLFDPLESKGNFVVPSRNNLYKQDERPPPFYPRINESAILSISSHYGSKPLKCLLMGRRLVGESVKTSVMWIVGAMRLALPYRRERMNFKGTLALLNVCRKH
jgi:hypothetical protein